MELSILIAKIIAVIYTATGVAVIIGTINLKTITENYQNSPALTFMSGAIATIAGIVLLHYHNVWVSNWRVIITLFIWMFFIGGILAILFPKAMFYSKKMILHSRYWGICMLLFGLLLGYFGFMT